MLKRMTFDKRQGSVVTPALDAVVCAQAEWYAGSRPEWVQPRVLPGWDVAADVTPAALEAAFARAAHAGRPAEAALVVSPTYFGTTSDIPGVQMILHINPQFLS